MEGNEIFTLKNTMLALHKSFRAEDAKDQRIFEVKGHFSGMFKQSSRGRSFAVKYLHQTPVLSSHSTVHFKNASDNQQVELEVKGDWFDRSASITWGGRPVAHISRSFFNVRQMFGDKQTVSLSLTDEANRGPRDAYEVNKLADVGYSTS